MIDLDDPKTDVEELFNAFKQYKDGTHFQQSLDLNGFITFEEYDIVVWVQTLISRDNPCDVIFLSADAAKQLVQVWDMAGLIHRKQNTDPAEGLWWCEK